MGVISLIWFALRQPETLPAERRAPLTAGRILRGFGEVMGNRVALGYTLMAGLISGAFQGYLSSAQQIFEFQYELGALFPLIFALNAVALGLASFTNGKLVIRFGMRSMTQSAILALCGLSLAFLIVSLAVGGQPPLWLLVGYLMLTFFCVGILFGNMNSMAMEPLGHIARRRCGRGRVAFHFRRNAAGHGDRPGIQRDRDAAGRRLRRAWTRHTCAHAVGRRLAARRA